MIFFLEENFPRPALAHLRDSGHKASHALDTFPLGTVDDKLFAHAQEQSAIFVTTGKDFFHTIPLSCARHHGAIVITLRKPSGKTNQRAAIQLHRELTPEHKTNQRV
jgi:predicted nuclease of predicted toxin-antitoxin system